METETREKLARLAAEMPKPLQSGIPSLGRFWQDADVVFDGDPATTQAFRFILYHLRIAADHDERVSTGARALVGTGL